ncbi:MAG: beta-ketoacyl-ACP synthase II [Planctomycetes bacterium]|nr:beta-ketoacyl-ACP synthase II [Planctomycetota bacterium]
MTQRRVVITGMGLITALGESLDLFWDNIINGRSGVKLIENFDTAKFPVRIGGEINQFNPHNYIDKREAKRIDRFALFALASSINAVKDSRLNMNQIDLDRAGVIIGTGIGGISEMEKEHHKLITRGPDRVSPFCVPKLMVNAGSANVSIYYKLRGANTCVVTACASAAHAIADAHQQIVNDNADIMITGGSEAALTALGLASFCSLKALSRRNDDPQRASRPFDRDRDGFVLAEGAGAIILEEYEYAKKRGANIYAEYLGSGTAADGSHITAPDADGKGACHALKMALRHAKLNPEQIDYINAHGTSTELNDISESKAIRTVFNACADNVSISSTKSHLGHLLGASGAVELIAAALAIKHGVIPPTINLDNPDPQCDLDYTPNQAREKPIKYAMSNSFGFGGHNASLIIGKI